MKVIGQGVKAPADPRTLGTVVAAETPDQTGGAKTGAQVSELAPKTEKGLIDVPASPPPPVAVAVDARQVAVPFNGFLKVRTFEVDVKRPGSSAVDTVKLSVLSGPGHNCSMAAPIALDETGVPSLVLKAGDTRAARTLRGEDYVKVGMIGGRWDKVGADPKKIGLEEIAEEIGARLVPGGFLSLGEKLVPTMPNESTEGDRYFAAIVRIDGDDKATGDHGGMEVVGLMKPFTMSVGGALKAMDDGSVGEGARARVCYQRALDAIGYVPELGAYVHDLPGPLKKRFDTLGLGAPKDPRKLPPGEEDGAGPAKEPSPPPAAHANAAKVTDVAFLSETKTAIDLDSVMIDAKTAHLAGGEQVGNPFLNQIHHVSYDRAKVAEYYLDPLQGPMVRMQHVERPAMALKALALDGERTYKDENVNLSRLDTGELRVDLGGAKGDKTRAVAAAAVVEAFGSGVRVLGAPCDASPGQSDLRYHFYAAERPAPAGAEKTGYMPLSQAIAACRAGDGDAATEAILLRLSTDVGWIHTLGMTVERAKKLAGNG